MRMITLCGAAARSYDASQLPGPNLWRLGARAPRGVAVPGYSHPYQRQVGSTASTASKDASQANGFPWATLNRAVHRGGSQAGAVRGWLMTT